MHEPWQLVLTTMPDGSTRAVRVWLPPLPGVHVDPDGDHGERSRVDVPEQVRRRELPRRH